MAEKRIEIQMATVGAEAAAAEVSKAADATQKLSNAQQDQAKAVQKHAEEHGKAAEAAGRSYDRMGSFATQAGYQISDFAVQVQGGTSALTAFSQQAPQLIGAAQQMGVSFSSMMSMSVGLGTAISIGTVAAGIGIRMLSAEYEKMSSAQDGAEASAARLAASIKMLDEAKAGHAAMVIYQNIADELRDAELSAEALVAATKELAKIDEARGKLKDSQRDWTDAARLRAGDAPETVAADRAAYDATRQKESIDARVKGAEDAAKTARDLWLKAEWRDLKAPANLPESERLANQVDNVQKQADMERAELRLKRERELAEIEKTTIDNKTRLIQLNQEEALKKRQEAEAAEKSKSGFSRMSAQDKAIDDAMRTAGRQHEQDAMESARDDLEGQSATAGARFSAAAGNAPTRASRDALRRIGSGLADGTNARELAKMRDEFDKATEGMTGATVATMRSMLAALDAATKRIEALEKRSKATRPIGG